MSVLFVTSEREKDSKRKLSYRVEESEQAKMSRSEGPGVASGERRRGSAVAKTDVKSVNCLSIDVSTESSNISPPRQLEKFKNARGCQFEKCGVARAVEPIRAELSSNPSECEDARAPEPIQTESSRTL